MTQAVVISKHDSGSMAYSGRSHAIHQWSFGAGTMRRLIV